MNAVDYIKQICKEKKIPISKLEKDLGFANGYIGKLKKGTLPADRASKIADYLEIPLENLTNEESKFRLFSKEQEEHLDAIIREKLDEATKRTSEEYYDDPETRDLVEFLHKNPSYKVLFDASRRVPLEDIELVRQLIDKMAK